MRWFYDWWNIFVRLADPDLASRSRHQPSVVLSAIATRTRHARQTTFASPVPTPRPSRSPARFEAVARFLRDLTENAEQLARPQTWRAILSRAFQAFLNGRLIRPPPRLAPA